MHRLTGFICMVAAIVLFSGCATPKDYTAFRAHHPRSILVLPPMNESTYVNATYSVLSTVTKPLAEMGYYVFPVAVIDMLLKENGLPTPGEMNQIPLRKIDEIIGADAVLYMTINEYGTKYAVLDSSTIVNLTARLVDVQTGNLLWNGHVDIRTSSSGGSNSLVGMLVSATLNQIVASGTDEAHDLSSQANLQLFTTRNRGLLYGPYHPKFGTD